MSPLDIDVETVKSPLSIEGYHVFGGEPIQGSNSESLSRINLNDPSERAAMKAMQTIVVELTGMSGTSRQLGLSSEDRAKSHLKHTRRLSSNSGGGGYAKGPYLENPLWPLHLFSREGHWRFIPSKKVLTDLVTSDIDVGMSRDAQGKVTSTQI